MSASIKGTTIELTRGDTLHLDLVIHDAEGEPYVPSEGDSVRFKMKKTFRSADTLIEKDIDTSSMSFVIAPVDTAELPFGEYVYDIQLTTAAGEVDTIIPRAKFKVLAEVD